ncbi:hypothetical protein [Actinocorallia aurantiaca]|uniref:Uncharacterized protein n=1 Tax=Actinocorallia aurantiaca TaxID=46204 RepID=A0ABN3UQ74_9ACTN
MRQFLFRYTTILVGLGAAGVAIGWIADDLRPAVQSSSELGR